MPRLLVILGLLVAASVSRPASVWSQEPAGAAQPSCPCAKTWAFDGQQALAGWTITGDVSIDSTKSREGKGGTLKIGAGGTALLKLHDTDGSGRAEVWVYDDGTTPEDVKASRVGPHAAGSDRRLEAGA